MAKLYGNNYKVDLRLSKMPGHVSTRKRGSSEWGQKGGMHRFAGGRRKTGERESEPLAKFFKVKAGKKSAGL